MEEPGVDAAGSDPPAGAGPPPGRVARARARAEERYGALVAARSRVPAVDTGFQLLERDTAIGGGILAGALAYRLFIWFLPLTLVLVGGLGVVADASDRAPGEIVSDAGLTGVIASSVSQASDGEGRWYALLIGIPILLYVTATLLRTLAGVHRLAWGLPARGRSASPWAVLGFLGVLLLLLAFTAVARGLREGSFVAGIVATVLVVVVYFAAWLALAAWLPHRDAPLAALVPGAALFAVGLQLLHLFNTFVVSQLLLSRKDAYGALGVAAAILFGLWLIGRLVIASAVLNAVLWERHEGRELTPYAVL